MIKLCTGLLAAMALFALTGCATNHPSDPLEPLNRSVFAFNDQVDKAALAPAATLYRSATPAFVQTGFGNFFSNLEDPAIGANNLLQGKFGDAVSDIVRFAFNTTFGIIGVFDISTQAGLPKHHQDFGKTLGYWGVQPGPYLVLPLLGSSTLRDTLALPVDVQGDPWHHVYPVATRNTGVVVRAVDDRATVLGASKLIEDAALDPYEFVRDAYMQRRAGQIEATMEEK
jgi:phospholipid-binding lipoprotein MlaA